MRQLQIKFNSSTKPVVRNTFQTYRTTILKDIHLNLESCKELKKPLGARIVKGAFIITEKAKSKQNHYVSPVCGNFRYTQQNTNDALSLIVKDLPKDSQVNISTCNTDCVNLCMELMRIHKIPKDMISFCQFRGTGDNISDLALKNGYMAYKQIPYGPVDQVFASVAKRTEDTPESISICSTDQIKMIRKELFNNRKLHIKGGIIGAISAVIMIGIL